MQPKPPLGLYPKQLWDEEHPDPRVPELMIRLCQVREAMQRYRQASLGEMHWQIPVAWYMEEMDRLNQIKELEANPC